LFRHHGACPRRALIGPLKTIRAAPSARLAIADREAAC
jgi:hypothetical protein